MTNCWKKKEYTVNCGKSNLNNRNLMNKNKKFNCYANV